MEYSDLQNSLLKRLVFAIDGDKNDKITVLRSAMRKNLEDEVRLLLKPKLCNTEVHILQHSVIVKHMGFVVAEYFNITLNILAVKLFELLTGISCETKSIKVIDNVSSRLGSFRLSDSNDWDEVHYSNGEFILSKNLFIVASCTNPMHIKLLYKFLEDKCKFIRFIECFGRVHLNSIEFVKFNTSTYVIFGHCIVYNFNTEEPVCKGSKNYSKIQNRLKLVQ